MQRNVQQLIICLLIICALSSCDSKQQSQYYRGFIIDETGRPIPGVIVREDLDAHPRQMVTDTSGYFRLKKSTALLPNLILSKIGYVTDTIYILERQHGERLELSPVLTNDSTVISLSSE